MTQVTKIVHTRAGKIATLDMGIGAPSLLLIHGNSGSKDTFDGLILELSAKHRVVALDLSGHGQSDDAALPSRDYTTQGYAHCVGEVVDALALKKVVVVGFSLGGFIGLELASRSPEVIGLMIFGAPPFAKSAESINAAFAPGPGLELSGKEIFSPADVESYVRMHGLGHDVNPAKLYASIRRCDGRARSTFVAGLLEPDAPDLRWLAENCPVPIAMAIGENDDIVKAEYFESVNYRDLWQGRVHRVPRSAHAPQMSNPGAVKDLVLSFAGSLVPQDGPQTLLV
jgi:pimeloyl-ACP methyl ester carboxylesterase